MSDFLIKRMTDIKLNDVCNNIEIINRGSRLYVTYYRCFICKEVFTYMLLCKKHIINKHPEIRCNCRSCDLLRF